MNIEQHGKMKTEDNAKFLDSIQVSSGINISSKLFVELREKIISGDLPPGYVFPNELALCEKLKIGRSSLREAFHALATIGLITRTKQGTYVNEKFDYVAVTPLGELLKQSDINDLMEFRVMLESEIAALAAARATDEDIALLSQYIEIMRTSMDDIEQLTKYDTRFHLQLSAASQNLLLHHTMNVVRSIYETVISQAFHKDKNIMYRAVDFHERILHAVKERDSQHAREVTNEHIMDVMNVIRKD